MSEEGIGNITKWNSLFAPTFVNHYMLPDVYFHGHCLIDSNISIPIYINIYNIYIHNISIYIIYICRYIYIYTYIYIYIY